MTLDPRPARATFVVARLHDRSSPSCPAASSSVTSAARSPARMRARDGAFALADGGTLFLDEVGELPLPLQAQLLRVVQERTYKRVGGNTWRATRLPPGLRDQPRPARGEVARGALPRATSTTGSPAGRVALPPLRERREDILPLARHFLRQLRPDARTASSSTRPVRDYLLRREYPGNVRDLRQSSPRMQPPPRRARPDHARRRPRRRAPGAGAATRLARRRLRAQRSGHGAGAGHRPEGDRQCRRGHRRSASRSPSRARQPAARSGRLGVTDRALQLRRAAKRERSADTGTETSAARGPARLTVRASGPHGKRPDAGAACAATARDQRRKLPPEHHCARRPAGAPSSRTFASSTPGCSHGPSEPNRILSGAGAPHRLLEQVEPADARRCRCRCWDAGRGGRSGRAARASRRRSCRGAG